MSRKKEGFVHRSFAFRSRSSLRAGVLRLASPSHSEKLRSLSSLSIYKGIPVYHFPILSELNALENFNNRVLTHDTPPLLCHSPGVGTVQQFASVICVRACFSRKKENIFRMSPKYFTINAWVLTHRYAEKCLSPPSTTLH